MKIREDLIPGNIFPNFERPDQDGMSQNAGGFDAWLAHGACLLAWGILTERCSPVGELCEGLAARTRSQLL